MELCKGTIKHKEIQKYVEGFDDAIKIFKISDFEFFCMTEIT